MKIFDTVRELYPHQKFTEKQEIIDGFDDPFHSLYIADQCIISILEGYEPKTGRETLEVMDIVKSKINSLK